MELFGTSSQPAAVATEDLSKFQYIADRTGKIIFYENYIVLKDGGKQAFVQSQSTLYDTLTTFMRRRS